MTKKEIIEMIREEREKALEEHKQSSKIAPSSYGHGVDWGMVWMCDILLSHITGQDL